MTISVVRRFTAVEESQGFEQWVLKGAAYITGNSDATVTVLHNISGDSSGFIAVEEWESMAAFEAGFQKLDKEPGMQAIYSEANGLISNVHTTIYRHVNP